MKSRRSARRGHRRHSLGESAGRSDRRRSASKTGARHLPAVADDPYRGATWHRWNCLLSKLLSELMARGVSVF